MNAPVRSPMLLLESLADAFNAHDIDAVLSMMTPDAVFETAWGSQPYGERISGHAELRKAFTAVWAKWPDARWEDATHVFCGNRAFSEWTFRGTEKDGTKCEVRGVDLFTVRDGLISRKDTFRKVRS